ncbi:MAG: SPOR domain-containing protein, partial [Bacteroidia bacterium]|nr:SPOR domain-containing protein [Bacteroidia bacterium]
VRINDRGPFKPTRIIDLSEEAAKELGILARGIGQVRVEVTRLPDETPAPSPPQTEFYDTEGHPIKPYPYGVQVGAFSESANAYVVAKNAWKEIREKVFIWRANAKGKPLYRVIIGSFRQRREAEKLRNKLKSEGWQAFVVHLPL